ncbi:MAG TPA: hypothetical protein VFI22_01790 [Thermomicrobiales bacterium]|nr:hypothetical protein [Thermomicrobiales bacterium]
MTAITIVWTFALPNGGQATVADSSPPLPDLDPDNEAAIVAHVRDGLGITLRSLRRVNPRGDERAAWAVRHGSTGIIGRMSVEPAS